jgi:hypothetical protein
LPLARAIATAPAAEMRPSSPRPFFRSQLAAALLGLLLGAGILGIWSASQHEEGLRLAGVKSDGGSPEGNADADVINSSAFRSALHSALSAGPSAPTQPFAVDDQTSGQAQVTVVSWFNLAAGTSCAEFKLMQSGAADSNGLACRRDDGGWEIMALPRTAP